MVAQPSNLSCLLYDPHDARFENREVPTITDPYDVVVRIAYVGVCGSDVSRSNHIFIVYTRRDANEKHDTREEYI